MRTKSIIADLSIKIGLEMEDIEDNNKDTLKFLVDEDLKDLRYDVYECELKDYKISSIENLLQECKIDLDDYKQQYKDYVCNESKRPFAVKIRDCRALQQNINICLEKIAEYNGKVEILNNVLEILRK